jgi:hypothetical protein
MKVWIGNLAQGTTVEKVEQLLCTYGLPRPDSVMSVPEGNLPAVVVEFRSGHPWRLRRLIGRIEGLYWQGNHLVVTQLLF